MADTPSAPEFWKSFDEAMFEAYVGNGRKPLDWAPFVDELFTRYRQYIETHTDRNPPVEVAPAPTASQQEP